jgi:E3 ubiquitin-protein ligase RAD18
VVQAEQSRVDELAAKPSSQRRFFEESPADHSQLPPSSQYSILEKDSGIGSDITTLRPLQP